MTDRNNDLQREIAEDDALASDAESKAAAALRNSNFRRGPRPRASKGKVALTKPKGKWVWFPPVEDHMLSLTLLEHQEDGKFGKDFYLLSDEVRGLFDEEDLKEKDLVFYVTKSGAFGFWPLRPQDDDELDDWNASAWDAVTENAGKPVYVKIKSGRGEYRYKVQAVPPAIDLQAMLPDEPAHALCVRAFEKGGFFIDRTDHPLIRDELGDI